MEREEKSCLTCADVLCAQRCAYALAVGYQSL